MSAISMKALLECGVHFGHRTHKWHPQMKPYIFTERNSIHIIDLQKTVKAFDEAFNLIRNTVSEGGVVLFVGTKRQAQDTIQDEATRVSSPYVNQRWLGGMLTNWKTIRQRINELERLERMRDSGEIKLLTKKEALDIQRKIERLELRLGGIRNMVKLPDLLFIVDVNREETAVHEANLLNIPIVAMVDTNCDPRNIDYVIPSNDDAIRAIKLMVSRVADAVAEGLAIRKDIEEELPPAPVMVEDEEELSDEDLLGEATLAKLAQQTSTEEPVDETQEEPEEKEEETGEVTEKAVEAEIEEETAKADEDEIEEETAKADEDEIEEEQDEEAEEEENYDDYEVDEEDQEEDDSDDFEEEYEDEE